MKRLEFEEACKRIEKVNCKPLFLKSEWLGVVKKVDGKLKKIKYLFEDIEGHEFISTFDNISTGHTTRCKECAKKSQIKNQRLTEKRFNNYYNDLKENKYIEILTKYKDYKNNVQKLDCMCLKCNIEFQDNISHLKYRQRHSCCRVSSGERITIKLLEENNIKYNYQVSLVSLNLTSDFEIYMKDGSILHLEIDGDQHYDFPNQFHKTKKQFLLAKERDLLKDSWYKNNGHKNLHIRYNHAGRYNDNINLILQDIVNGRYGNCVMAKNKKCVENVIEKYSNSYKCKKIIAYTLDGNFYKVFDSGLQAEKELNVNNGCISQCVNKKQKKAKSFMFEFYKDNFPKKIKPYEKYPLND